MILLAFEMVEIYLEDEMNKRGWSQADLARRSGAPGRSLNQKIRKLILNWYGFTIDFLVIYSYNICMEPNRKGANEMKTKKQIAKEIAEIIKNTGDQFNHFGVRAMTQNPKTLKYPRTKVGRTLPRSHNWEDGNSTNKKLRGTCAVQVVGDHVWDDLDGLEKNAIKSLDLIFDNRYTCMAKEIVFLGSETCDYGDDLEEIIMRDHWGDGPTVLAKWSISD